MDKTASILVIGDEVLSGQVQEAHVQYIAKRLEDFGIELKEVRMITDDVDIIAKHINDLRRIYDYLFTTGGIGGTHDDKTCKGLALAFNEEIVISKEIEKITNDKRQCFIPKGASLIENSISKIPGFSLENVYCLAGFPSISKAMFESVIKTIEYGSKIYKRTITINHIKESEIADKLEEIQNNFKDISIGSYPFYNDTNNGITFVIKGRKQESVDLAFDSIQKNILKT